MLGEEFNLHSKTTYVSMEFLDELYRDLRREVAIGRYEVEVLPDEDEPAWQDGFLQIFITPTESNRSSKIEQILAEFDPHVVHREGAVEETITVSGPDGQTLIYSGFRDKVDEPDSDFIATLKSFVRAQLESAPTRAEKTANETRTIQIAQRDRHMADMRETFRL